jgi:hypothetical protein
MTEAPSLLQISAGGLASARKSTLPFRPIRTKETDMSTTPLAPVPETPPADVADPPAPAPKAPAGDPPAGPPLVADAPIPPSPAAVPTVNPGPLTDPWTIHAVVIILGVLATISIAGTIGLVWSGKDATSIAVVSGLAGTALGALASMLASTRSA